MIYAHQEGIRFETLDAHIQRCKEMYTHFDNQNKWTETLTRYFNTILKEDESNLLLKWIGDMITFHDFGKQSESFQFKLGKSSVKNNKGDHALPSAVAFLIHIENELKDKEYTNKLELYEWGYRLAFIISSHHSTLRGFHAFEDKVGVFREKAVDISVNWFKQGLSSNLVAKHVEYDRQNPNVSENDWECMRLIFGMLCLCDYYATTSFMENEVYKEPTKDPMLTRQKWYWENNLRDHFGYIANPFYVTIESGERKLLDDFVANKINKIGTITFEEPKTLSKGYTFPELNERFIGMDWNKFTVSEWNEIWLSDSRIACMRYANLTNAGILVTSTYKGWLSNYGFSNVHCIHV